ncbi:SMI1/KNR4 family protein [Adhaeribacter swui]|uniref:SMI1/KNR4 family protein n=1 Tax=Adhaeribacter swui TaxID=2086471 RepID=A0A7G7GAQ4_9BACT|nr:SMI1/KNR4 family protein [Adhaeribacter swui]QNF34238.1 SMI1/KNR4 family protein [Adhaeribacter swui]
MKSVIDQFFKNQVGFTNEFYPPGNLSQVLQIEQELDLTLPEDYKAFIKVTNGFKGFVGENYCTFNKLEELVEITEGYCKEYFPWAVQIGSDGGGEMYVLGKRNKKLVYGILPAFSEEEDFIPLGTNFEEFIKRLYYNDYHSS